MIRAVFFDVGHTLLKSTPSVGEVYAREAERLGAKIDHAHLTKVFSRTFAAMSAELARSTIGIRASDEQEREMWHTVVLRVHAELPELKSIDGEAWFERLHEAFGQADHWTYYPDALPTLEGLRRRGLKLGVVSNWSTRLRHIAEGLGMTQLMDFFVISAEVGVAKPDPRIFRKALELANVDPNEAVHVGDLVDYDVRGAQSVGIKPVLLHRGEGKPTGTDYLVVRDLRELIEEI